MQLDRAGLIRVALLATFVAVAFALVSSRQAFGAGGTEDGGDRDERGLGRVLSGTTDSLEKVTKGVAKTVDGVGEGVIRTVRGESTKAEPKQAEPKQAEP